MRAYEARVGVLLPAISLTSESGEGYKHEAG